jgi:hypothetical protein
LFLNVSCLPVNSWNNFWINWQNFIKLCGY